MADNWVQTAVVALGASLLGSTTGFLANLYLTTRKEKFDSKVARRKHKSELYLKRADLVDILIAQLLEYKGVSARISELTRAAQKCVDAIEVLDHGVQDEEDEEIVQIARRSKDAYYEQRSAAILRGREILSDLLIRSEKYGEIPNALANLDETNLSAYISVLAFESFDNLLDVEERHHQETRAIFSNINALLVDLRTLAKFEVDMASQALLSDGPYNTKGFRLPYFELIRPFFELKTVDYAKVNIWFLEERQLRHDEYRKRDAGSEN